MSQQNSRPENDSRANRLPYHAEARQGRFGRVENWREAEEKKIEELRQRRKAASRSSTRQRPQQHAASQQRQPSQGGAQPRGASGARVRQSGTAHAAGKQKARQVSPQQDPAVQRAASHREDVNPWQQGRFGRVENWREVEERRRAQEQLLEQQREAELRAKQEAARKRAAARAQEQEALGAHSKQALRAKQSQQRARSQQSGQQAQAQHDAQRAQAQQRAQRLQAQQREQIRQRAQEQEEDLSFIVSKHPTHTPASQKQRQGYSEPEGVESASSAFEGGSSKLTAKSYARETYTSSARAGKSANKGIVFNASGARDTGSKYDRRPAVEYSPKRGKHAQSKDKKSISPKLIAVVAAIFVVIVAIGAFNIFTPASEGDSSSSGQAASGGASLPTPIMSESSGLTMHSAVAAEDLTEILIHNASYAYANEITTQLTEATNTEVINAHGTGRVASEQPTGDNWLTGEFIRCFRSGNAGPTMSAIDCGGAPGSTVYAPVSGEVVLVKEYQLYDQIDDFRVHIQPTGRPDLDVVLIHLTDVMVQPGDKVVAGVTPIAKIRDLFQYLDESIQLRSYTAEGDNGNHTHIQVNNATHPEYTALNELKPEAEQ